MGNVSIDFEKIVSKAVKRYVFKEDVPKVVACIMKDYNADEVNPDAFYRSFGELANASSVKLAVAVFDEFLSDSIVEEYTRRWLTVEQFRVRFAAHLDAATAAEPA